MARGLAHCRISPCPALFPISFRSRAYELVMTPEWCLTGTQALATGMPAPRSCTATERPHLLQSCDEGFDLELVRCEAAFQPDAVRILIRDRYPTPNLVSHMLHSMPDRLRRAQRPERSCLLVARMPIRERQSPEGVERRSGAGPTSLASETGKPKRAKLGRAPLRGCAAPVRRSVRRFLAGDALPGSVENAGLTANPSVLVQLCS
jgi:hypothetical protein